jgi:Uma2 family endonuclease
MADGVLPTPRARPVSLESGDHLTRAEFERIYDSLPHIKKAELIEGVVYMPSPVRWSRHSGPHLQLITWLGVYQAHTPGVQAGDNATVRLPGENAPQPDAALIIVPQSGGQVRLSPDDYLEGGPELVAEVAAGSAAIDLHAKLEVYQQNGVREYIVWRVLENAIDWLVLRQRYEPLPRGANGWYHSEVFPGLWLDPEALLRSDLAAVLQVVLQGVASAEHAAFVARLQTFPR